MGTLNEWGTHGVLGTCFLVPFAVDLHSIVREDLVGKGSGTDWNILAP